MPGQRDWFARRLGEPYLVGVPNRDFLIAFQPALRPKFAPLVAHDYRTQSHPITPRLLRIAGEHVAYDSETWSRERANG